MKTFPFDWPYTSISGRWLSVGSFRPIYPTQSLSCLSFSFSLFCPRELIELLELTLGQFSIEFIAPTNRLTDSALLTCQLAVRNSTRAKTTTRERHEKQLQQKEADHKQKTWINIDESPVEHEEHMHSINNIFKLRFLAPCALKNGYIRLVRYYAIDS